MNSKVVTATLCVLLLASFTMAYTENSITATEEYPPFMFRYSIPNVVPDVSEWEHVWGRIPLCLKPDLQSKALTAIPRGDITSYRVLSIITVVCGDAADETLAAILEYELYLSTVTEGLYEVVRFRLRSGSNLELDDVEFVYWNTGRDTARIFLVNNDSWEEFFDDGDAVSRRIHKDGFDMVVWIFNLHNHELHKRED